MQLSPATINGTPSAIHSGIATLRVRIWLTVIRFIYTVQAASMLLL